MDGVGSFFFGSNVAWSWCCEYSVLVTARVTRDGDKAKACETVIYREARSTLRRLKATVNAEWIRAAVLMMVKEEGGRHHNKPKKCLFGNCRMVPAQDCGRLPDCGAPITPPLCCTSIVLPFMSKQYQFKLVLLGA